MTTTSTITTSTIKRLAAARDGKTAMAAATTGYEQRTLLREASLLEAQISVLFAHAEELFAAGHLTAKQLHQIEAAAGEH